jgi:hypothetical protein
MGRWYDTQVEPRTAAAFCERCGVFRRCAQRTEQSARDQVAVARNQPAAGADLGEDEFVAALGALVISIRPAHSVLHSLLLGPAVRFTRDRASRKRMRKRRA